MVLISVIAQIYAEKMIKFNHGCFFLNFGENFDQCPDVEAHHDGECQSGQLLPERGGGGGGGAGGQVRNQSALFRICYKPKPVSVSPVSVTGSIS